MLYEKYGDRRVLERHYSSMKKWMELIKGTLDDGITRADNYGDWCVPPKDPEVIHTTDPKRKTAKGILATSYYYYDLKLMARYARLLDRPEDRETFLARARRIRKAFNDTFFKPEKDQYDNGSQTSSLLPLAFDLVPAGERQDVAERLIHKIMVESNAHVGTGLIGCQWLMRTLTDFGHEDLALAIASQRDYPSWGYMVEQGATTIWELWNGDTANPAMNSRNHVMLVGDLYIWFNEYLAGIRSHFAQPGYQHFTLNPVLAGDLKWVKADHRSPYGRIVSNWSREGGKLTWHVNVPANSTATAHVPTADAEEVMLSDHPAADAAGVTFKEVQNGKAVFELQSGEYHFTSPLE
jgi:alpha-L-rhamnosidase